MKKLAIALVVSMSACASMEVQEPVSLGRCYDDSQMATILAMRADGRGLKEVARVVGGTREDVRSAERALRVFRHSRPEAPLASVASDQICGAVASVGMR